jgi:hydrogenase expression/formation protein HypE
MARAAAEAGVEIVSGDTKVVDRGKADGVFITTSGIGIIPDGVSLGAARIAPGDAIIVSGSMGDHGMAILSRRENIDFDSPIESDCAPLNGLVEAMLAAAPDLHALRDPTRGGLAAVLNELAHDSATGMLIDEQAIPVSETVHAACELLGLDPVNIANEGKLVAFCSAAEAERLVAAMRRHPRGLEAAVIGRVTAEQPGLVRMKTCFGGERVVDWLNGEQLPRIC